MKLLDAVSSYLDISCIGFDLGHGKTALAVLRVADRPEVSQEGKRTVGMRPNLIQVMPGKDYILTAYAEDSGKIFLGDSAFSRTGDLLELGFKGRPHGRENLISKFVTATLDTINHRHTYQWDVPTLLVVGRPSGWNEGDHEDYQKLFDRLVLEWGKTLDPIPCPEVCVLPESRAAFLYLRDFSGLTAEMLGSGILVLDMGSSTTDWTYAYKFKKPKEPLKSAEDGKNLGAILIDALILQQSMETLTDDQRKIILDSHKAVYGALYQARIAKENYFKDPEQFENMPCTSPFRWITPDGSRFTLNIDIDKTSIEACLTKPLNTLKGWAPHSILRFLDEEIGLEEKSWLGAFRDILNEAKARCRENERPVEIVYLTGGASRMDFVSAVVKEFFPEARLVIDSYPELCIANGLAWAGCWLVRQAEYERKIQEFIDGAFISLISKGVKEFLGNIIQDWYSHVIRPPLKSTTTKWINFEIAIDDLNDEFIKAFQKHWEPLDINLLIKVENWKTIIKDKLETETRQIMAILGEPRGIELSEEDYEEFGGIIVGVFLSDDMRDVLVEPFGYVLAGEMLKIQSNLFGRTFQGVDSLMDLVDSWVKEMYSEWVNMIKKDFTQPLTEVLVENVKPRFFAASHRVLLDIE